MVTMKSLMAFLTFSLCLVAALPQNPTETNTLSPTLPNDVATANVSNPGVMVNFYMDKNPVNDVVIDPETCKGKAEIALMKWRARCKTFFAVIRLSCYTRAPSEDKCCPLYRSKSCAHFWPRPGEWRDCLIMREQCGKDCNWMAFPSNVRWCWKYAPDI